MKNKKHIIIFLSIVILVIGLLSLFLILHQRESSKKSNAISRYEWMQLLGDYFGLNEPKQAESLWSDIEENSPYFKYVQAATEWDVIPQKEKFHGEDALTGSFMAETVLKSIGEDFLGLYIQELGGSNNDYIDLLIRENFLKKEELKKDISKRRAKEFLADITEFYQTTLKRTYAENVVYKDGVIELPRDAVLSRDRQIKKITVDKKYTSDLKVGNYIALITERGLLAKKIVSKKGNQLSLEHAKLDKILDSMVCNQNASVEFEDIAKAYGVKIKKLGDTSNNQDMQTEEESYQVQPLGIFDKEHKGNFASKGFEIEFSLYREDKKKKGSIKILQRDTGRYFTIPMPGNDGDERPAGVMKREDDQDAGNGKKKSSFSKQAYIHAKIDVSEINVSSFAKMSGVKPKKIEVTSNIKGEVEFAFGGMIDFKKEIFSLPLYGVGNKLGVYVKVYLICGIDGKLRIATEIFNSQGVVYEAGKGIRKVNPQMGDSTEGPVIETSVAANLTLSPGVGFQPVLRINDEILFEFEVDLQVELGLDVLPRMNGMVCIEGKIEVPKIHIGVLEDDSLIADIAEKFGKDISTVWDLPPTPYENQCHFENGKIVDECTYEGDTKKEAPENVQSLESEYSRFQELLDYKYTGRKKLAAPFKAEWEGYKTKMEIYYYPTISYREFSEYGEGDTFTILGKKYTRGKVYQAFIDGIGGVDTYKSKRIDEWTNPHECCEIYDEEGHTYYIRDLINPPLTERREDNDRVPYYEEDDFEDHWVYWFCDINGVTSLYTSEIVDVLVATDAKIKIDHYNEKGDYEHVEFSPLEWQLEAGNYRNLWGCVVNLKVNDAGFVTEIEMVEVD